MGILDHLTCLLSNLYAGPEVTIRTRNGTMDWFQIGKGVRQGCTPCLGLLLRTAGSEFDFNATLNSGSTDL